ncbi:MAG: hypothetical protein IT545_01130 [Rhodobacteraceae bacterium]|nr:hypothetical protein [Paracoccaceae bacterium]
MHASIEQMAGRVAALLEARHGLKGAGLAEKVARGGTRLPRELREEAEILAGALEAVRTGRFHGAEDHARAAAAYDVLVRGLAVTPRTTLGRRIALRVGLSLAVVAALALLWQRRS